MMSIISAALALTACSTQPMRCTHRVRLRSSAKMQSYIAQQGYDTQRYGAQHAAQVVWTIAEYCGVKGYSKDWRVLPRPPGRPCEHDQKDFQVLPYSLYNGEEQVLSRWNMLRQKLTVSRVQCKIQISADGSGILNSRGKGPTLWRAPGGAWNVLNKEETHLLANGDQVSLDCNDPESAVFSCQVDYVPQDQYEQEQGLPAGWIAGVDPASSLTYYYNEQTGESQWEPPGGYPPAGY